MSAHPNLAVLDRFVSCIQTADLEGMLNTYAEDGLYRVGGDNLVTGTYAGRDAIRGFFYRLFEITGGTMVLGVDDTLADDDHAFMFWHLTAEREGKALDARGAMAFKINADGLFSESWFLYNDQREYDEFWS